jgi:hypothetical protein
MITIDARSGFLVLEYEGNMGDDGNCIGRGYIVMIGVMFVCLFVGVG